MPDPLETYLTELRDIHRSGAGVKETSCYGALANLLNEIGKKLKPRGPLHHQPPECGRRPARWRPLYA
jgi:hypothetical protein